ncbi:MAG: hypothetical protein CL431_03165 [Acidimicrobiaceae bacterium]|nr:hypothetical protein [Acidimicrobiaceae bacterium]|tara:strand:- start:28251 stop:29234 length:984 start_codon:yes stop_codon:yes gene_type:complete
MENQSQSSNSLGLGDTGARVKELHRMLQTMDFYVEGEIETFSEHTRGAITRFQEQRGLITSGQCDQITWDVLVENSYVLGDRLLYLRRPMLRGEDIAELQRSLGALGFNPGKVDGIFGPDTQNAVELFQRNSGLVVDAIFGPNCMVAIKRLGERVEQGSVAVVQEKERIITKVKSEAMPTIVIGHLGGFSPIADGFAKKLRELHMNIDVINHYDESEHADICNKNNIDLYIGIFPPVENENSISFYSAKGFTSPGGSHFTELFKQYFLTKTGEPIETLGNSEKILRETRMPAVVLRFSSTKELITHSQTIFEVLKDSVLSWFSEPFV